MNNPIIHNLTVLTFGRVIYGDESYMHYFFNYLRVNTHEVVSCSTTICYQFDNPTKRHQIGNYGGDQIPEKSVLDY